MSYKLRGGEEMNLYRVKIEGLDEKYVRAGNSIDAIRKVVARVIKRDGALIGRVFNMNEIGLAINELLVNDLVEVCNLSKCYDVELQRLEDLLKNIDKLYKPNEVDILMYDIKDFKESYYSGKKLAMNMADVKQMIEMMIKEIKKIKAQEKKK